MHLFGSKIFYFHSKKYIKCYLVYQKPNIADIFGNNCPPFSIKNDDNIHIPLQKKESKNAQFNQFNDWKNKKCLLHLYIEN